MRKMMALIQDSLTKKELTEDQTTQIILAINDNAYELDLSAESYKKFEAAIKPFIANEEAQEAKKIYNRRTTLEPWTPDEREACRAWAFENGYEVPAKGRIRKDVREAWEKAGKPMN
ncbi:Lsr2 dimerization domain-containing protein [Cutibacterium avidum]|uniref:Lsr2 family DNA-binding protein n=1 Tax=Cutibacterium avidum TaxID=33010 RepID=UPI002FF1C140|nr:Lsr2 family protein [Streptococcus salivarius]